MTKKRTNLDQSTGNNPYAALRRIFHEPNRLAIMSHLAGETRGASFNELRESCGLTDGNLARHLKALEEAGAVSSRRTISKGRPRTVIRLSDSGREAFAKYLGALEWVLHRAERKLDARAGDGRTGSGVGEEAIDGLPGGLQSHV